MKIRYLVAIHLLPEGKRKKGKVKYISHAGVRRLVSSRIHAQMFEQMWVAELVSDYFNEHWWRSEEYSHREIVVRKIRG